MLLWGRSERARLSCSLTRARGSQPLAPADYESSRTLRRRTSSHFHERRRCTASGIRCSDRHKSDAICRTVSLVGSSARICRNSSKASAGFPFCRSFSPRSTRRAISCRSARLGVSAIGRFLARRQSQAFADLQPARSRPLQDSRRHRETRKCGNGEPQLRRSHGGNLLLRRVTPVSEFHLF